MSRYTWYTLTSTLVAGLRGTTCVSGSGSGLSCPANGRHSTTWSPTTSNRCLAVCCAAATLACRAAAFSARFCAALLTVGAVSIEGSSIPAPICGYSGRKSSTISGPSISCVTFGTGFVALASSLAALAALAALAGLPLRCAACMRLAAVALCGLAMLHRLAFLGVRTTATAAGLGSTVRRIHRLCAYRGAAVAHGGA